MRPVTMSNRCRPFLEWPAGDQQAWNEALRPRSDGEASGVVGHWSAGTRHTVATSYGRWLTWVDEQGMLDPQAPAARQVTPDRVSHYLADLRATVALFTVVTRAEQLGHAMRALAPGANWYWLQGLANKLRVEARAMRAGLKDDQGAAGPDVPPVAEPCGKPNAGVRFDAWPAPDRAAWAAGLEPGDILEPGGVATRWAPTTRDLVVDGYGHWLAWLAREGVLDPQAAPAARVTRQIVAGYLGALQATLAPYTVASRIQQLGDALRTMAPTQDWRWLQRGADRIRARAVSVRDKRSRLQSPEQLAVLGTELMRGADEDVGTSPPVRAVAYRDGLLIAFLAHRPIRQRSLASMQLGQHVMRRGAGWWVIIPAVDTKTEEQEFPFPEELVPSLTIYLERYRPVLASRGAQGESAPTSGLWVSRNGTQMGPAAIAHQVADRTRTAFGVPLSTHLFRDCAATGIAISAPEQVHIIRAILGHSTLATSERHYNLAGSLEASRRYGAAIQELRCKKAGRSRLSGL